MNCVLKDTTKPEVRAVMTSKQYWFNKIQISRAIIDDIACYYLVDENLDFIPHAKSYIDMQIAKAGRNVSPSTIRTYCYGLRYFYIYLAIHNKTIEETDGDYDLMIGYKLWLQNPYRFNEAVTIFPGIKIEKEDCEDLLSIPTLNQYISNVSTFYNWLVATKIIKKSPVPHRMIATPTFMQDRDLLAHTRRKSQIAVNALKSKEPKRRPKTISKEQFQILLEVTRSKRNRLMLLVMYDGGVRLSELLGIWLEDIDFGACGIWIRFRVNNANNSRAKAGYGRDRFIVFNPNLMALIDDYISSEWLNSGHEGNYLFVVTDSHNPRNIGNPLGHSAVHSLFATFSKKAGFHINPHMLRHTHATEFARQYIRNGEPINWKAISERLGHASVKTTMDTYAHLSTEDYKNEYLRLTAMLQSDIADTREG